MEKRNVYVIDGEAAGRPGGRGSTGAGDQRQEQRVGKKRSSSVAGAHGGIPRVGASCSMLVSGTGHLIHRRWIAGLFYLVTFCCALAAPYVARLAWPRLVAIVADQGLGEADLLVGLLLLDAFFLAALLAGVYTAYSTGLACGGDPTDPQPHPIGPAAASLLVPGWGQIVNGQPGKAVGFLSVVYAGLLAVGAWLAVPGPIDRTLAQLLPGLPATLRPIMLASAAALIGSVTWAVSLYDAVLVARYRRAPRAAASGTAGKARRRKRARPTAALYGAR